MKAKLLIVTDLGLLKAFQLDPREEGSPRISLREQLVLEPAHQHLTDRITDSAGRRATPGGGMGGGTMTDGHNLELETKRRLIKEIAKKIQALINLPDSPNCWLAAQKEILRPILESLPPPV
ncbi:MAG: host attachment protein, partial [Verrucomicrobia bacterium]|nr:host attachment protein [Verrucomicrobiota bacterium]